MGDRFYLFSNNIIMSIVILQGVIANAFWEHLRGIFE
jgi:hypothetical protein